MAAAMLIDSAASPAASPRIVPPNATLASRSSPLSSASVVRSPPAKTTSTASESRLPNPPMTMRSERSL
jgi:hypothetical protein